MISLIIALIILILIIIITFYGLNSALRSAVDTFLNKKENFSNYHNINKLNQIPELDACKKLDKPLKDTLRGKSQS